MRTLRGLLILDDDACRLTYGPDELFGLGEHLELLGPSFTRQGIAACPTLLSQADVILSGWGGPRLDAKFLDAAPRLRAVFYAAGSLSSILTDAVWSRGITVTSAVAANAVPVAEYALATILFSLKHGWRLTRKARELHGFDVNERNDAPGCYDSTVGIVSLGAVGRKLLELLDPFDLDVLVFDPFLSPRDAAALGVTAASLEDVFKSSDVVSLHTPQLAETEGLITGELLASMKPGATFINTARPMVVRQDELIDVAALRPDLHFVLDVAHPEPAPPDSPLYTLGNVTFTPHIAGSCGRECRRMGRYMVEELERFVTGLPLRWAVTRESIRHTSHRPPDHDGNGQFNGEGAHHIPGAARAAARFHGRSSRPVSA